MDNEHLTAIANSVSTPVATQTKRKCVLNTALWPFISFLVFSFIYVIVFKVFNPEATDIVNTTIAKIFKNYSLWFGVIFAFFIMLSSYVLHGIKILFRGKNFYFLNPFLLAIAVAPWFILAYELLYKEKRYTDIGRGLITYVGKSLWITTEIMLGLCVVWFIVSLIIFLKKK